MNRQQGKTFARTLALGELIRNIEIGKTVGVVMADKFVTITAQAHEEAAAQASGPDLTRWDDEIGSIAEEEWERLKRLLPVRMGGPKTDAENH